MTQEQEKLIRAQAHRLLNIVLDTNGLEKRSRNNTGTMPTMFFEYCGHVNSLLISMNPDGWVSGERSITLLDRNLDRLISEKDMQGFEAVCKEALTDKTEADVLARDIEKKTKAIMEQQAELRKLKKQRAKLVKKERRSTEAGATVEL